MKCQTCGMERSHLTKVCLRQWDDYEAPAGEPRGRPATPGPEQGMVAVEGGRRSYAQVVSSLPPTRSSLPPTRSSPSIKPDCNSALKPGMRSPVGKRPDPSPIMKQPDPSPSMAPNVGPAQSASVPSAASAAPEGAFATAGGSAHRPRLMVEISTKKSGGRTAVLVALADSGATTTLVTKQAVDRVRLGIREMEIELTGLNGPSSTVGEAYVWLQVAEVEMKERVRMIVVDDLPEGQEMLLACGDLKRFGLLHPDFPKPCGSQQPRLQLPISPYTYQRRPMGLSAGCSEGLRKMEDAFTASELDSEPLTIDRTLFRHQEDDDVHDIPGLSEMPLVIRETLLRHRSVFANELSASRKIKCDPLHLQVRAGAEMPPKCHRARPVHHHWRKRAEEIIRKMEAEGIIVAVNDVTPAVSAGFFVKKPHGKGIRFVADYSPMNKVFERNLHHFPAPHQVWQRVTAGSRYFLAADLSQGYWQCELDHESSLLTTCLTEFGKFRFTRLAMGCSPSGDLFNQTTDNILQGIENMVKEVDDILLFSDSIEGIAASLEDMLQRCEDSNVTLAPKKLQFGTDVLFAGLRVTEDGCTADPEKMEAVSQFPRPESKRHVRQLLGLAQQFAVWVPDMAPATVNLRSILKKATAFVWTPECEAEYQQIKVVLCDEKYIKPFDPSLDTELLVDTSKVAGAGYLLIQRPQGEGEPVHIVRCGSVAAKKSWASMAPVEAEATGLGWAVQHCSHYLKGSDKTIAVITDHYPLVSVFDKCVFDLSQRLWNVRSLIMDQRLEVRWVPGKQQAAADALGRNPVWPGTAENAEGEDYDSGYEEACYVAREYRESRMFEEELSDPMLEELFVAAKEDTAYQEVLAEVVKGLSKAQLKLLPSDHPARAMAQQWNEISVMQRRGDRLMVYQGSRLVVPVAARKKIKEHLHIPHLGQKLTHQAGALRYWWPGGFREELYKMTGDCDTCAVFAPSRQREPEAEERYQPKAPMDMVATDLFEFKGAHYLLVVDVYSGYPWYKRFTKCPDTRMVTEALNDIFLTFGYPKHLKADGGPQYRSGFKDYCRRMFITDHTTSAFNSQSNGEAERAVGKVKALMRKVDYDKADFKVAFSRLRDAPMVNSKMSPARLMHRRALRFPGLPSIPDGEDELAAGEAKQRSKVVAKERRNTKVSKFGRAVVELEEGLHVVLQDMDTKRFDIKAQVVRVCEGGRSAYVRAVDKGGRSTTFLRNRRFMDYDRDHRMDEEAAMAAVEGAVAGGCCLPWRRLSGGAARYAAAAARRASGAITSILKGTLARLTQASAAGHKRKRVSWGPTVGL